MNGDDAFDKTFDGEPATAPEPAAPSAGPEETVARLEAELAETKDRLLRALAETENQRQRHQRDRQEAQRYAAFEFARELLNVADNLRRAIDAVPGADSTARGVIEGVAATERELLAIFERHGIKRVEPALGEPFDHNRHEAMFEVPGSDQPPGTIAQVLQPGYVMHDRLLRPALVGVAKAATAEASPAG
ncbi:MAG: nucleotide exchange factor GrpE [Alphaproteobacteria bacterium]|nr:nucleotide exchange factor GrpE [Alphaproteobacteria bacterium]